jgi:hypothetical protein
MGTFAIVIYLFHIPLENKLYESNTFYLFSPNTLFPVTHYLAPLTLSRRCDLSHGQLSKARQKVACLPAFYCHSSGRPLGDIVCLLVHLQIHESTTQGRRTGIPYGVCYMFIALVLSMNARFNCVLALQFRGGSYA